MSIAGRFVFVDRDGTLVRDEGYTFRIEDYERLPGASEGLLALQRAGYRLAIVTNQSGIGRGYYGEPEFAAFTAHLLADLRSAGVEIERVFHCPHRPEQSCACRKPRPGLLARARDELGADLGRSWVIGDTPRDLELAANAGCRGAVLVHTGEGASHASQLPPDALQAADLAAAAQLILGRDGAAE